MTEAELGAAVDAARAVWAADKANGAKQNVLLAAEAALDAFRAAPSVAAEVSSPIGDVPGEAAPTFVDVDVIGADAGVAGGVVGDATGPHADSLDPAAGGEPVESGDVPPLESTAP